MNWQTDIVNLIRPLVGDLDGATYSDLRLLQVAIMAAYNVNSRMKFNNEYVVNLSINTVTPNPFELNDSDFNILTAYKAACIIISSEIKSQAGNSISIKDGPSAIDLTGIGRDLKVAADSICSQYEKLEFEYMVNGSAGNGQAVLSPYSPGSDYTGNHSGDHRWQ